MTINECKMEARSKMYLTVIPQIEMIALGEERCGEEENGKEKYGEGMFGLFENNSINHV